jgi:hypothetical protein
MTIEANEGTITGTGESQIWQPIAYNDPATVSNFNVFVCSEDFAGTVRLLKSTPPYSTIADQWFQLVTEEGTARSWDLVAGDAFVGGVEEPESQIPYKLVCEGTGTLHYRFSL